MFTLWQWVISEEQGRWRKPSAPSASLEPKYCYSPWWFAFGAHGEKSCKCGSVGFSGNYQLHYVAYCHESGMMIRRFSHWLFVIFGAVYLVNRLWLRPSGFAFVDFYLNDLLCMPLVLYCTRICMVLIYSAPNLHIPVKYIVVATFYLGWVFEWLLPAWSPRYTADPFDLLMYIFGALLFLFWQRLFVQKLQAG